MIAQTRSVEKIGGGALYRSLDQEFFSKHVSSLSSINLGSILIFASCMIRPLVCSTDVVRGCIYSA